MCFPKTSGAIPISFEVRKTCCCRRTRPLWRVAAVLPRHVAESSVPALRLIHTERRRTAEDGETRQRRRQGRNGRFHKRDNNGYNLLCKTRTSALAHNRDAVGARSLRYRIQKASYVCWRFRCGGIRAHALKWEARP